MEELAKVISKFESIEWLVAEIRAGENVETVEEELSLNSEEAKPDWCPLRALPEKMKVCGKYPQPDRIAPSYKVGWNACLDEILK